MVKKNYNIPEMDKFYKMDKKDINKYAECAAYAYEDYPLFKYVTNGSCNHEVIKTIIASSIYSMKNQALGFSNREDAKAVAIFTPPHYTGSKAIPFLLGGGIKLIFLAPLSTFVRLLRYENHSMKLKKKYTNHNCWYLYNVTVKPELQNKGNCSEILNPMFKYFDRIGEDCYLETHLEKNVKLYKHYDFELVEISTIPKTNIKQYSMIRKANKNKKE